MTLQTPSKFLYRKLALFNQPILITFFCLHPYEIDARNDELKEQR